MESTKKTRHPHDWRAIFSELEQNGDAGLLIVPNRRTARWLHDAYDQYQRDQNATAWQQAPIMALSAWLDTLTLECIHLPWQILSAAQENVIWQEAVASIWPRYHDTPLSNTHQRALAKQAQSAWALLHDASLSISHLEDTAADNDRQFFHDCAQTFQKKCQQQHWMSIPEQPRALAERLALLKTLLPTEIQLYGFDHITPSIQHLLDGLATSTRIIHLTPPTPQGSITQTHAEHALAEWTLMMRWAKATYLKNPTQRIVCLIPDLAQNRAQLVRLAERQLNQTSHDAKTIPIPYNISSGTPCIHYRMIQDALGILQLSHLGALPHLHINAIITSPYIQGAGEEMSARALLDAELRSHNQRQTGLKTLTKLANTHRCPRLAATCQQVMDITGQSPDPPRVQSPQAWISDWLSSLQVFGWPGDHTLCSEAYQLHQSWHACLKHFASLSVTQPAMAFPEACSHLQNICSAHLFQKEAPIAPIEILGVLEGATLPCDHIWVAGMTDQQWPEKPQPHPFLPIALQKRYQMPHASAEKELAFSTAMLDRITHNAKNIILSHPRFNEQSQPCSASALIADLAHATLTLADDPNDETTGPCTLEKYADDLAPAVTEPEALAHGTQIFQHQANCPFQAFAIHRLHARPLPEPKFDITPADKGALLHRALDHFWRQVQQQSHLQSLSEVALNEKIQSCVAHAMEHGLRGKTTHPAVMSALRQSLAMMIHQWLSLEKKRDDFQVSSLEASTDTRFFGIPIRLRPDRIDQLPNGQYVLIDYKTGQASMHHWLSEPLAQTQMPLYVMALPLPIEGVAYGHVKLFECQWRGLIHQAEDVDPSFPELTPMSQAMSLEAHAAKDALFARWRTQLEDLAKDFLNGIATVDPQWANSCQYCDLSALCRVHG